MQTTPCRACGAPMIWTVTAINGKAIPLDAEPVPEGNIVIIDGRAVVTTEPAAVGELRYVSHFATCPEAKRFRKGAKR